MRVEFNSWREITAIYEAWWEGTLGRPVANLCVVDSEDVAVKRIGPRPALEFNHFTASYADTVRPAAIVDSWDWHVASRRYIADGFPSIFPNFGAGVVAAMTGCEMEYRDGTVWFEAAAPVPSSDLRIDPAVTSPVAGRIKEIYAAAADYFRGTVQLGMTDLGGALDVLQSFFPGTGLSLELYDNPDQITRLVSEVHEAWWNHFDAFNSVVSAYNPGYTAWTPLLSTRSYYMLQCDFAFMIGPEMFAQFVLPELSLSCLRLERPFYHLDGEGQLAHLDQILDIPNLAGVQWIPGDGAPEIENWPEVYRKIRDAGKRIQFFLSQSKAGIDVLDVLADQLGSLDGVAIVGEIPADEEDHARDVLASYGIPW